MYVYLHSVSTRCAFKFIHQSRASWPTKELARVKRKEHTLCLCRCWLCGRPVKLNRRTEQKTSYSLVLWFPILLTPKRINPSAKHRLAPIGAKATTRKIRAQNISWSFLPCRLFIVFG